jgi:photosystem II stability/assembly factor-like uncharacterized protein
VSNTSHVKGITGDTGRKAQTTTLPEQTSATMINMVPTTMAVQLKKQYFHPGISELPRRLFRLMPYLLLCGTLLLFVPTRQRDHSAASSDENFERLLPQVRSTAFFGPDVAWLVGSKSGDLWRTQDGGGHWDKTPGQAVGGKFYSVNFINELNGWAVGTVGSVWQSDDGGRTWLQISKLEVPNSKDWSFLSSEQIRFIDSLTGWIVETFGIWRTEDGGINWQRVLAIGDRGITGQPSGAAFLSSSVAVVSSDDGKVYRTEDSGKTWQVQTVFQDGDIRDISFADEHTGWLTGYGPPDQVAVFYRSTDGGRSWRRSPVRDGKMSAYSMQFLDNREGWAVGAGRRVHDGDSSPPKGLVMRTTDGGDNWKEVQVPSAEQSFEQIHFADSLHGWLLAREDVYRTEDGGKTWRLALKITRIKDTP